MCLSFRVVSGSFHHPRFHPLFARTNFSTCSSEPFRCFYLRKLNSTPELRGFVPLCEHFDRFCKEQASLRKTTRDTSCTCCRGFIWQLFSRVDVFAAFWRTCLLFHFVTEQCRFYVTRPHAGTLMWFDLSVNIVGSFFWNFYFLLRRYLI